MTDETPPIRLRKRLRRLPTSVPQDPDNIQTPNKNETQATTINRLASRPRIFGEVASAHGSSRVRNTEARDVTTRYRHQRRPKHH